MFAVGAEDFSSYGDYLEVHPPRIRPSVQYNPGSMLLRFFRDQSAWTLLNQQILPAMIAKSGPIRIWCAGLRNRTGTLHDCHAAFISLSYAPSLPPPFCH